MKEKLKKSIIANSVKESKNVPYFIHYSNNPITKLEELHALQWLRSYIKVRWGDEADEVISALRKVTISKDPPKISYATNTEFKGTRASFNIVKNKSGEILVVDFNQFENEWWNVNKDDPKNLTEAVNPKLQISKEEEIWARNQLSKIDLGNVGKTLKKIEHFRSNNPFISDRIGFEGTYGDGRKYIYRVRKKLDGKLYYFIADADTKEDITIHGISFDPIDENILKENKKENEASISRVEELHALQFIRKVLLPKRMEDWNSMVTGNLKYGFAAIRHGPDEEKLQRGLTKIKKIVLPNEKHPNIHPPEELLIYKTEWDKPHRTFLFVIRKLLGVVKAGWIDTFREPYTYTIDPNTNFSNMEVSRYIVDFPTNHPIFECIKDYKTIVKESGEKEKATDDFDFYINKLEEYDSLNQIKKKLIPIFVEKYNEYSASPTGTKQYTVEEFINSLKKIKQTRGGDLGRIRSIVYGSKIRNFPGMYMFGVTKTILGELLVGHYEPWSDKSDIVWYNYDALDREFDKLRRGERLIESTGDWQGWGDITLPERERLVEVLKKWQDYIKKIYAKDLASTMVYLVQKCIDNLDSTDPRIPARPLASLGMETRLYLMDYIDHVDTTGMASKVIYFLMDLSREYIKPPTPPKPDIELKNITDIVYLYGHTKGNVTIAGLEDMRPTINFGYGSYTLDDKFYDTYSKPGSELYIDWGQRVRIVNMPDVMRKVKDAITKFEGGFLKENNEVKKCVVSREEEIMAVNFINRLSIGGVPVKNNLKKFGKIPTRGDPSILSDSIIYTSLTNNREKIIEFEIFNSVRRGGLYITITWGNHRADYRYDEGLSRFIDLGSY